MKFPNEPVRYPPTYAVLLILAGCLLLALGHTVAFP